MPEFTIITPIYNGARFLPSAIRSVQAQTLADWEWILVDDGSTDGSLDLCRAAAGTDHRIKVLSHGRNRGPSVSRNLAIRESSGDLIGFLDCDDLWSPEKLELDRATFARHPRAALLYSRVLFWFESAPAPGGRAVPGNLGVPTDGILEPPSLLVHIIENLYDFACQFPAPSCLALRRSALPQEEDLFDPPMHGFDDFVLLPKLLLRHPAVVCDDIRVFHRRHAASFSQQTDFESAFQRIVRWLESYTGASENANAVVEALRRLMKRRRRERMRQTIVAAGRQLLPFRLRDFLWRRLGEEWLSPGGIAPQPGSLMPWASQELAREIGQPPTGGGVSYPPGK